MRRNAANKQNNPRGDFKKYRLRACKTWRYSPTQNPRYRLEIRCPIQKNRVRRRIRGLARSRGRSRNRVGIQNPDIIQKPSQDRERIQCEESIIPCPPWVYLAYFFVAQNAALSS